MGMIQQSGKPDFDYLDVHGSPKLPANSLYNHSVSDAARAEIKRERAETKRSFSASERFKIWLISWAGFLLIRAIGVTLRYSVFLEPGCVADSYGAGPPAIWCFWHRAVIPATYRFRNKGLAVMTSRSFDGEYIARIIQKLGFRAVRGSSSRGAVGALIGMRQEIVEGTAGQFRRPLDGEIMPFLAALQHEPLITPIPNEPNALVCPDVVAIPAAE